MRLLIRVDASLEIGYGHIMRCLSIAEYCRNRSIECAFIHKKSKASKTVSVHDLGANFNYYIINEEEDIKTFYSTIEHNLLLLDINNKSLFTDKLSYKKYIAFLKKHQFIVVSFEEFEKAELSSDLAIIPYVGASKLFRKGEISKKMLLGHEYFVFRNVFLESPKVWIKENAENILVCMGGSDPDLLTEKYLSALVKVKSYLNISIVLARISDKRRSSILKILSRFTGDYTIFVGNEDIAKIISTCDIGIINSGLIKYETALLGLPCISVSNNFQHEKTMSFFCNEVDIVHMGISSSVSEEFFLKTFKNIKNDTSARKRINTNCLKLFDGNGLSKIHSSILKILN